MKSKGKDPYNVKRNFSNKKSKLLKNAEELNGKRDMRKKFIKSDRSTYSNRRQIRKAQSGLKFTSYITVPTNINYKPQSLGHTFSEYNYPSTISQELNEITEDQTQKQETTPQWIGSLKNTPVDDNISFEELIKRENLPVRISSGYRGPGDFRDGLTASGKPSNHSKRDSDGNPMAYDIVPLNGNFDELLETIYSNPRVVNWFKNKGWGILEEFTSEAMKGNGATGKHLHVGPDRGALEMFRKRISKAQNGLKFTSYMTVNNPIIDFVKDVVFPTKKSNKEPEKSTEIQEQPKQISIIEDPIPSKVYKILDRDLVPWADYASGLDLHHKFGRTDNKFKEFAEVMTPIYRKALEDNGYSTSNLNNIVKQAALESGYGLKPRGYKGFNLGGIKFFNQKGYIGSLAEDGQKYVDFENLMDYANYHVRLLNNKYNALTARDSADFASRLHGQNPSKAVYSGAGREHYLRLLNGLKSLEKYLNK